MFRVRGRTIEVSAGDTGVIRFAAEGAALTQADRAVFTVKKRSGETVIEKIAVPQGNEIRIPFVNADTEHLRADTYLWDIRYVLDAKMDEKGAVTDGREVITPMLPGAMHVMKVVGSI